MCSPRSNSVRASSQMTVSGYKPKFRGVVQYFRFGPDSRVFAHQKDRMGLFVRTRTIGLGRARLKIGMVNLAYNMQRFLWLRGRTAPA